MNSRGDKFTESSPKESARAKCWNWLSTFSLGIAAVLLGQIPAVWALYNFHGLEVASNDIAHLATNAVAVVLLICVSTPIQTGLLFWMAQWRSPPALDYLALRFPSKSQLALLVLAAAGLLVASDASSWLLGSDVVTSFQTDTYRSARAAGVLPWLWLAVVIVAPIGEETLFRGFLFRGWQRSAGVPWAAIGATALLWAVVHVQYNAFVIAEVLVVGLALGWMRWATRSTVSTIFVHALLNAAGMAETYLKFRN